MAYRSRRPRRKTPFWRTRRFHRTQQAILAAAAVLCLAAAYCITQWGGSGGIPSWAQLGAALEISNGVPVSSGAAAGSLPASPAPADAARVHFIDVGQGDSVLIEQNGAYALIDCGTEDCETELLSYLEQAGVQKLALLVMTHPHADHIGSMDAVLEKYPVEKLVLPQLEKAANYPTAACFEHVVAAAEEKNVDTVEAQDGDVYTLGGGTLTVLGAGVTSEGYNDISLDLLFQYGDFRFLDTGDGEKANEKALLAAGADVSAAVFKAAHHGSRTSNTLDFMQAVRPKLVVVSCGLDNDYGHPNAEALEHFAAVGARVYRTDRQGSVVVEYTAADGVTVMTQKEAAA